MWGLAVTGPLLPIAAALTVRGLVHLVRIFRFLRSPARPVWILWR